MQASLSRKLGPLKAWQWGLAALAALYLLRHRAVSETTAQADAGGAAPPYASYPPAQQGAAQQAAPSDASSPGSQLDGAGRNVSANGNAVTVNLGFPPQGAPGVISPATPTAPALGSWGPGFQAIPPPGYTVPSTPKVGDKLFSIAPRVPTKAVPA